MEARWRTQLLTQNFLFGDVVAVNNVNNEIFGQFMCADDSCVGHLDPRTDMKPGEKTKIAFNMANAHVFSPVGDRKALA